jgi:hypothetical protein
MANLRPPWMPEEGKLSPKIAPRKSRAEQALRVLRGAESGDTADDGYRQNYGHRLRSDSPGQAIRFAANIDVPCHL